MTKVVISPNWRNSLMVKHLFTDDAITPPELIVTLCDTIIRQLKSIQEREKKSDLNEDSKEFVDEKLTELIDHFDFLRALANGSIEGNESDGRIPKEEWKDYEFDGNFQRLFNDYMAELYDLADERVDTISGVREKFIWIK